MKASERLLGAWYDGHWALTFLRPLEWLYRRVVLRKRERFLKGLTSSFRAPVPVLIVGNLTVGGTGKTPLILYLIEYCRAHGLSVGVVSRGYGASPPAFPWHVSADQSAVTSGDEPLLIVQRSGVPLVIDPDRPRAIRALLDSHAVDLILCDDGLQHYQLARDLEIVLIDAARGLGNGRCLPAGPLREPVRRLAEVDAIVYNGRQTDSEDGYGLVLQPTALVNLHSGERCPLTHFPPGQRLHAVAGIGNPARFFHTLQALNWQPIPHVFADHAVFDAGQLHFSPELPLIMTEKDAVKCRSFAGPDWWYLSVDAEPSPGFECWLQKQLAALLPDRFD